MQSVFNTTIRGSLALPCLKYVKSAAAWQIPAGWPDIRTSLNANACGINLLICNAYPNLGFKATCGGGYSVYINGTKQGDYASGAQCSLTLASLSGGFAVTYPSAYTAHRVEIRPTVQGSNITAFALQRVAASGAESQGLLWAHFALTNPIDLFTGFVYYDRYSAPLIEAVTAQNGVLNAGNINTCLSNSYANLKTFPVISASSIAATQMASFTSAQLKSIVIKNISSAVTSMAQVFYLNTSLKAVRFVTCSFWGVASYSECHKDNRSLINLPKYSYGAATDMTNFLTNAVKLQDTYLDVSSANALNKIGCYGTAAYFMGGFKGLKVSSSAPFAGTAPQINVSYTGMTRAAIVSLFESLPTVSAGQVVQITGTQGASALSSADLLTATAKGWTVTI